MRYNKSMNPCLLKFVGTEVMMLQTTVKDTNTTEYIAIYCRTACADENATFLKGGAKA